MIKNEISEYILPNGIYIQKGLSRMFSNPVSCVDNRFLAVLGGSAHSSRYGVTQHYYICVTGQYLNGFISETVSYYLLPNLLNIIYNIKEKELRGQVKVSVLNLDWVIVNQLKTGEA